MRIVQFLNDRGNPGVARVAGNTLQVVAGFTSTYALAQAALQLGVSINELVEKNTLVDKNTGETLSYDDLLTANRILPPVMHPDPARLWVTGTGLTHLGSAAARDSMHKKAADTQAEADLTDSMKMFNMGLRDGKPEAGQTGAQPEWFYKGNGTTVAAPGAPISSPAFALLDGDEIEICTFHIIGDDGTPYRIGYALGNEFSDHKTEKINYLYLAHSKLRACSYGPELLLDALPADVRGASRIRRNGEVIWEEEFLSGEDNMSHSLANLEHHHFKYDLFRQPGDVHCHFLGTATASFSKGIEPQDGDVFEMEAKGFGMPLRNTLRIEEEEKVTVGRLYE
ncbi:MAG: AraD1 family protein [Rhodothermales bacterium]